MKEKIYLLLTQKNIDASDYNIEKLYIAGINNIVNNIEFYFDKPYTCESVLRELFNRGVLEEIKKLSRSSSISKE